MFLIERLVGVGVYSFILVLVSWTIASSKSNKKVRFILFLYTIALAIMGFFYVPYVTADLARIYNTLDYFKMLDFSVFMDRVGESSTVVANIYYWLVSKTGENRLLPAINAFICYSCIFYIFRKTMEKYNISKKNFAIALFFYMAIGNYMFVISGIRTMLAISLVAYCFFREAVEKKFRLYHILLYVAAAFIHNFAVIIIIIRLVIPLVARGISFWKRMSYILFLSVLSIFAALNMTDLLESVFGRADGYITGENMYSYFWEYLIGAFVILISVIALIKVRSKYIGEGELSQIKIFSIVCILLSLAFCFEFTIFHRLTTYACAITSTPILMLYLDKCGTKNKQKLILWASIALLFIACARGTLCSLKFFIL